MTCLIGLHLGAYAMIGADTMIYHPHQITYAPKIAIARFGLIAGVDPNKAIGSWKEAWESVKEDTGVTIRFRTANQKRTDLAKLPPNRHPKAHSLRFVLRPSFLNPKTPSAERQRKRVRAQGRSYPRGVVTVFGTVAEAMKSENL